MVMMMRMDKNFELMKRTKFNPQQIADLKAAGFEIDDDGGFAGADNCRIEVECYDGKLQFVMCPPNGTGIGTIGDYDVLPDGGQQAVENPHILSEYENKPR
jgi:hypothetical protein